MTLGAKMPAIKEQVIVNQIIQYLNYSGNYVWRQNTGGMTKNYQTKAGINKRSFIQFGHKGVSDILGISKDGKFIAVECKVKGNKPTQFQLDFLESISSRGGIAILAYSLEDVQKVFESASDSP